MLEEMKVDLTNFQAKEEDYSSLKEAVSRLANASEDQFNEIKKEKWFNRVFDLITFSQKGKKRLAEQVGTLAQAQQILIELLMRLSENDAKVSDLVIECMEDIRKIQEQNIYLLNRINTLEDVALGIKSSTNIALLSEKSKQLLSGLMYYLANMNEAVSEYQQKFANSVLNYLDCDVQMSKPFHGIEDLDNDQKRIILTCCMEYLFLNDLSLDMMDINDSFINEFDFGSKTIKSVNDQILSVYKLRGVDGFLEKYRVSDYDDISELFSIEFEELDEYAKDTIEISEESEDDICIEAYRIDKILKINQDETLEIRNKDVIIDTFINCEGELYFENCIINVNQSNHSNEITLNQNANLYIKNCIIVSHGFDERPFISGKGNNSVQCINSTFFDCSNFINLDSCKSFVMDKCELRDCYLAFVCLSTYSGEEYVEISNNIISFEKLEDFNKANEQPRLKKSLFYVGTLNKIKGLVHDNYVNANADFNNLQKSKDQINIFDCDYLPIQNCTFTCIVNCIKSYSIKNSNFINCSNAIKMPMYVQQISHKGLVDNCVFENCSNILTLSDHSTVSNCQFVSCNNNLIGPQGYGGGITVEFCEFYNTKCTEDFMPNHSILASKYASIYFNRSNDKTSRANYIKKCIFKGVEVNYSFLIAPAGYDKPEGPIIYIEDCDFFNCSTKRDSGQIIKEKIQYDTLFKKNQDFIATNITNCKGLDRINIDKGTLDESMVHVNIKTIDGILIGSGIVGGVIAVAVGGPIGLNVYSRTLAAFKGKKST